MFDWISNILGPIEWVVSWIMVQFHSLFTTVGMDPDGGLTWALSIVGLVVVIRILLIPLFVKQIRSQRGLQLLQPQIKELQKKHKDDRERQSQELMKLYKDTGTNPLASCLPILAQAPIFFALFRVLNEVAQDDGLGYLRDKQDLVDSAANATLFGARISDTFLGADNTAAQVVAAVLIVLMSASMFITQKQLMTKNMPAASLEGPFAQQQKILLYLFPLIFLVTGINFPIGVLIYWFTTNVWSLGQQLFVIARMPAPGSIAAERLEARRAAKAGRVNLGKDGPPPPPTSGSTAPPGAGPTDADGGTGARGGQRQQPKRAKSAKRPAPRPPGRAGQGGQGGQSGQVGQSRAPGRSARDRPGGGRADGNPPPAAEAS